MKKLLCIALLLPSLVMAAAPLVYQRQPRESTPISQPGRGSVADISNWQKMYDAGAPNRFTEWDLVLQDDAGITVLYDCTTSADICAAHDPRVSPDGRKISFTVARGYTLYSPTTWDGPTLTPAIEFNAIKYEVWVYDIAGKTMVKIDDDARQWEWVNNQRGVFSSTRANTYPSSSIIGNDYQIKAFRIYEGDMVDNKLANVIPVTPHAEMAMSPAVMSDGDICWAEWQGFGARGYKHTPVNMWWVQCAEGNLTNYRVVLGAHGTPVLHTVKFLDGVVNPNRRGVGATEFRVLRPIVEIRPNVAAVTNYYRSNHVGGYGAAWEFDRIEQEGYSLSSNIDIAVYQNKLPGQGRYVPNLRPLTPFGTDGDDEMRFDLKGRPMGKAAFFAPSPMGNFLFSFARGTCYEATNPTETWPAYLGTEPPCKREIHQALVPMVTDPFDPKQSVVVACPELKWNCSDARYVMPYSKVFGKPMPDPAPPAPTGTHQTLQVVNARASELMPLIGPDVHDYDKAGLQGNARDGNSLAVTQIVIDRVEPWTTVANRIPTLPQGRDGLGKVTRIGSYPIEKDGSVKIEIPCGITYLTSGAAADGTLIAHDNALHPAVCGETVTCHGCHDAHSIERAKQYGRTAEARFMHTIAGGCGQHGGCEPPGS